jgi:hypothetical protein
MQLQFFISCLVCVECIILKLRVFSFSYRISRSFAPISNGLECKKLNKILEALFTNQFRCLKDYKLFLVLGCLLIIPADNVSTALSLLVLIQLTQAALPANTSA